MKIKLFLVISIIANSCNIYYAQTQNNWKLKVNQSIDSTDNNGNTALILGLKLNFSHFISYFIL
jgi:hypothetical protein